MEEQQTKNKPGRQKGYKWTEQSRAKMRATLKAKKAIFAKLEVSEDVNKPEDFGSQSTPDDVQDDDNFGNK